MQISPWLCDRPTNWLLEHRRIGVLSLRYTRPASTTSTAKSVRFTVRSPLVRQRTARIDVDWRRSMTSMARVPCGPAARFPVLPCETIAHRRVGGSYRRCRTDRHNGRSDKAISRQRGEERARRVPSSANRSSTSVLSTPLHRFILLDSVLRSRRDFSPYSCPSPVCVCGRAVYFAKLQADKAQRVHLAAVLWNVPRTHFSLFLGASCARLWSDQRRSQAPGGEEKSIITGFLWSGQKGASSSWST